MNKEIEREIENFIQNIVWLHKHNRLSKTKMARILGVSVWSLYKLESGVLPPRMCVDIIYSILDYFGVEPSVLFTEKLK